MLKPEQKLAHFTIIRKLGAGGMGEVYLAEDMKLQRKVALKILLPEFFEDKERQERFKREAKTAAQINHQNVMSIYDIGEAPDPETGKNLTYIVMEYIEGQSLTDYLAKDNVDINELIRIAEHIAAGLAAAHKINVVHRDIKAGNIIIAPDNSPKILDFGLAKPVSPLQTEGDADSTDTISQELTKAGKIVGTISYMSPEQIKGEPVDNRSDIFAFGILLYRMVTGTPPFEGETQVSTMAKILETNPEPPRLKNSQIPMELERIIEKCLHKNPNDRYQDTRDLVVDLRNLRRQFDSDISSNISSIKDLPTRVGKARIFWLSPTSLIIGIIVIFAIAFFSWKMIHKGMRKKPLLPAIKNGFAILGFENKTGNPELDWLETGLPEILQTDLAQGNNVTIISRDRILDCIDGDMKHSGFGMNHEQCIRIADSLGAKHAISGTFYKLGDRIRIDARIEDLASGEIVSTAKAVGDDPFVLVDSLTEKIAASLNMQKEFAGAGNVSSLMSSSPEAYKIYREGMNEFGLQLYDKAIAKFKKAINIDSTFAMSYMRIGMSHVFMGHHQEGAKWFALAKKYQNKLPVKEKSLLDIYSDMLITQDYDNAFAKTKAMVSNYPDDKETRTFYALMIAVFERDTTHAFAQLDTVLQIAPKFLLALSQYSQMLTNYKQYDRALQYAQRAMDYYPNTPLVYSLMANIYRARKEYDKAAEIFQRQIKIFPDNVAALHNLYKIAIFNRNFDEAKSYVDSIEAYHSNDPYEMSDNYSRRANLALWKGQFRQYLNYLFSALKEVEKTDDSSLISGAYSSISNAYSRLELDNDSVYYYGSKEFEYAPVLQRLNYPLRIIGHDPSKADSLRPIFQKCLKESRKRFPEEFWPVLDAIEEVFDATISADTVKWIKSWEKVYEYTKNQNRGLLLTIGFLCRKHGDYKKAIDLLEDFYINKTKIYSGYSYLHTAHELGRAYESVGQIDKAIECYRQVLKYWSKADIQIEIITDSKERLAKLTT